MSSFYTTQRSHLSGHDTGLPKEVIAALPNDADAQLSIAMKIMNHAYAQRVAELEADSAALQESLNQRHHTIKGLERKLATFEVEVQELQQKNRQYSDAQAQHEGEKAALVETIKRLNREVVRLESFKRNLMQTLTDDDTHRHEPSQAALDLSTERLVHDALALASPSGPYHTSSSYTSGRHRPQSPTLAPAAAAAVAATGADSRRFSSPPRPAMSLSPTSTSNASPRLDGKEFFKQARSRLSYEHFSRFLQIVKELNSGSNTRDDTLRRAKELFGVANADLYGMFQNMLSRNVSPQRR